MLFRSDIVTEAYETARRILTDNRDKLDAIARRLMEVETLDFQEFVALMGGAPQQEQAPVATPA